MSRKAQAAVFMVIALIILISGSIYFYLQKEELTPLEAGVEEQPQFAGQTELRTYVDSCLQSVVLQGLEILSLQSGYIEIPVSSNILSAKDKEGRHVKNLGGSKKIVIEPSAGNKVPYWLTSENIAIPSLDFMEKELSNYVAKELRICVNDFADFKAQGFSVDYDTINANVEMSKAVVVNVDFPITLKKQGIILEERNFAFDVPINFELLQKTASDLAALEDFHAYLEDHTKNLISLYSGISSDKLPPFYQSTTNFDCNYVSWSKEDVKNKLKNILNFNIPNLKVEGTNFNLPPNAVYESFVYDLLSENLPNIKIDFAYENEWEFLAFDIIPSSGSLLKPEKVVGTNIPMLPQICVFKYPFKYTMQYPVLVKITDLNSAKIDPKANAYFEGRGFTFQFPLTASLCGNQNRRCVKGNFPLADATAFAVANTTLLPKTLFCEQEQRISSELTIKTFDSLAASNLGNVDVNYYCGSYQNDCFIGKTDNNGLLKAKFPLCINGHIYFSKDGYSVASQEFTTYNIPVSEFSYFLNPKNSLKVEVKKINIPSIVRDYFENKKLDIVSGLQEIVSVEKVTIVSDTGLFYIYPDPAARQFQIDAGTHKFNLQLSADVDIKDTIVNGQTLKGFKGNYQIGSLSAEAIVSKQDLARQKLTFYVLANYDKNNLNPATYNEIDDPILEDNGNLEAELLYSCEKENDVCNFDKCSFVDIDGRNIHDFNDNLETCGKAFNVTILKEQYYDLIKPIFS